MDLRIIADDLDLARDRVAFAESLGIVPDPWQRELLESEDQRVLLNCSRQSGKSLMAALLALHTALYETGSLVLILAPAERQARETFSKVINLYRKIGQKPSSDSDRKLGLEISNGSRIEALPGSEKTIRGFSNVGLLLVDEAARIDDELYFAVRPMLAVSGGRLLMLSTPYGRRGIFHSEWTDGMGWRRFEVPATDVPRIDDAFLLEERRSMPDSVFRQEYMCEFAELEGALFSEEVIERMFSIDFDPAFPDMPGVIG